MGPFAATKMEYLCLGIEPTLKGATIIATCSSRRLLEDNK